MNRHKPFSDGKELEIMTINNPEENSSSLFFENLNEFKMNTSNFSFHFYFSSKKLLNFYRYLDDTESYIESERKVVKEEKPQVLGIITLEDIIESALKEAAQ